MILYILKRGIGLAVLIYTLMIIAALVSVWLPQYQDHTVIRLSTTYTAPYLHFFKQVIPPLGSVDLSWLAAILSLQVVKWLIFFIL